MFHTQRTIRPVRRQGQALLVAVLLMMVILLTGILFVAIVSYNQFASSRSVDVVAAQNLAQAGIRWCDDNLTKGPMGADWRPPFRAYDPATYNATDPDTWPIPPVELSDGTLVGVYGADGIEETSDDYFTDYEIARNWHGRVDAATSEYLRQGFVRIPDMSATPDEIRSSGTLPPELGELGEKGHVLVRVTYDPDPPFEAEDGATAANILDKLDPMSKYIKIEAVGVVDQAVPVWRKLIAYKPIGLTDYLLFVTDNDNKNRITRLGFGPRMDLDNDSSADDWLAQYFYGPMKFNSPVMLQGDNSDGSVLGSSLRLTMTPEPTNAILEVPGANPIIPNGGYLRADKFEATGGIKLAIPNTVGLRTRIDDGTITDTGFVQESSATFDTYGGLVLDGDTNVDAAGISRVVRKLPGPAIFGGDGAGAERYRKLTRDSGRLVTLDTNEAVNLGQYGFGRGLYIDNKTDLQYIDSKGVHDLDALTADWMRAFPEGDYTAGGTGWNAMQTLYTAPGVEITLFPDEASVLSSAQQTYNAANSELPRYAQGGGNNIWWPGHTAGEPGIRLTRTDGTWQWHNPATNEIEDSQESTLYVDYPEFPNQVIFAEGNVRIHGVLPAGEADDTGTGRVIRDYNLSVVSGGSIYIDGQILSPQDCLGRAAKDGGAGAGTVPDELNTKIALLARDNVCLNATRLVPQLVSGQVGVAPDDPVNPDARAQHYVLTPGVQGAAYSNFSYGEIMIAGNDISITAAHTGADPGPTAMSMSIFSAGSWTPYLFGNGDVDGDGANEDVYRFYLAQPGMMSPTMDPSNFLDYALGTVWGRLLSATNPHVPWSILAQIADGTGPNPGRLKSVALSAADLAIPGFGAGAHEYWIKKWKINETNGAGDALGALHAKVNALIYAESGCWFVIPGDYFDASQTGNMATRFRRYNYDICVRGMISECFHASQEAVQDWSDKWAYPLAGGGWATLRYEFDESLRVPRHQPTTTLTGRLRMTDAAATPLVPLTLQSNLPKLPALPVSNELIFMGEGN